MISSLLHLVGLRPRVYYTLTNFRGGARPPCPPPLNTPIICSNLLSGRLLDFVQTKLSRAENNTNIQLSFAAFQLFYSKNPTPH